MVELRTVTKYHYTGISITDIVGLWEVIRIIREDKESYYPWLMDRFRFFFTNDMIFECYRYKQHTYGTWELIKKRLEDNVRYSVILNSMFEYVFIDFDNESMELLDPRKNVYFLTRKL